MPIKPLFFETYLKTIENSPGSKIFQDFLAEVNGKKTNITKNGGKSCAFFVSGIFKMFDLIKNGHVTVKGTLADMKSSGWKKIKYPKKGCILHWEPKEINGKINEHIGFYIGNKKAVSNGTKNKVITEHHWTYGKNNGKPNRKIIAMYWHKKLENKYF